MSRATFATIHLAALRENLRRVRQLAPHSRIMAVVKADGYGHGLERVAHALASADAFGVATLDDAQRLRAAGLSNRIVLLEGFDEPSDLAEMRRLRLESIVHHSSQIEILEHDRDPRPLKVWLKVDSGMHRLGFAPDAVASAWQRLRRLPQVEREIALMSHFASADVPGDVATPAQIERFTRTCMGMDAERSLANSAGVLLWPQAHADWVRVGGLLYGISAVEGRCGEEFGLHPAMSLSARIIAINTIAAGERVGYAGAWQAPQDMRIAVAAIGYGDGYPRHAATGTPVLLRGRHASVVGRVSMDMITLDLREHDDAEVGDTIVLWGRGLPVETVAACSETIGYELVCGMTRRVQFVEDPLPVPEAAHERAARSIKPRTQEPA